MRRPDWRTPANLGIIAAGFGVAVYAVLWVGLLVCIKKESKLNVLTQLGLVPIVLRNRTRRACRGVVHGGLLTSMA